MTEKEWYKCKWFKSPIGVPMCMNPKKEPIFFCEKSKCEDLE